MADLTRSVILRILGDNDDAKKKIDETSRKADDLGRKKVTVDISATDQRASSTIDNLTRKLDILGRKKVTVDIEAKEPANSATNLTNFERRIDLLGRKRVTVPLTVDTARAMADIATAERKVDEFGRKNATAKLGVDEREVDDHLKKVVERLKDYGKLDLKSRLGETGADEVRKQVDETKKKLDEFGHSKATAEISVHGSERARAEIDSVIRDMDRLKRKRDELALGGIGATAIRDLEGGKGGRDGGFLSSLLGRLGGGGEGGGGGGGGLSGIAGTGGVGVIGSLPPQVLGGGIAALMALLPAIVGGGLGLGVPAGLVGGQVAIGKSLQSNKEPLPKGLSSEMAAVSNIGADLEKPFIALAGPVAKIINGMIPIIRQIAPILTGMFKESLPFLREFGQDLLPLAKILFPAISATLHAMLPSFPLFLKGINVLTESLGLFMKLLGPGMKGSSELFIGFMYLIKGILAIVAITAAGFGGTIESLVWIVRMTGRAFVVTWNAIFAVNAWLGKEIRRIWNDIMGGLKAAAEWIGKVLVKAFEASWNWIKDTAVSLWHFLVRVWNDISSGVSKAWNWLWNNVKNVFHDITSWIGNAANAFWHFVVRVWNDISGGVSKAWDWLWQHVKNIFHDVTSWLGNAANAYWHFIVRVWNDISGGVSKAWDWLWQHVKNTFHDITSWVGNAATGFWHFIVRVWNDITGGVSKAWDFLWNGVKNTGKEAWDWIASHVQGFWHDIVGFFQNIWHDVTHFWDQLWSALKAAAHQAVSDLSGIINGVKNAFEIPIRFVVDHVWDPLAGLFNKVTKFLHIGLTLPTLKMAEGGPVPGPKGAGDVMPALLTPGEHVLTTKQVSQAGGHQAISSMFGGNAGSGGDKFHFAGGGSAPSPGSHSVNPAPETKHELAQKGITGYEGLAAIAKTEPSIVGLFGELAKGATGVLEKVASWTATQVFDHMLEPIVNLIPSGNPVDTVLKDIVTMIGKDLASLIQQGAQNQEGGAQASDILAFAKTFVGKVPYHLGGGADYAPYGEIKKPADANRLGGWDCAGFVGQMYGHFGMGPGPAGINVGKLMGWGKKTKSPVPGGFAVEAGDQTAANPGHVVMIVNPTTSVQAAHTGTDTIIAHDSGAWLQTYIPPMGFGGAANFKAGSEMQDGRDIYQYLLENLFAGHQIAAAGATASMWGESMWNPESVNCVPLDYKVVTSRGILSHNEVRRGDVTPVYSPVTGQVQDAIIIDVPYHYDAPMYRIGNENWSVTCTRYHSWITTDGELVKAMDMELGATKIMVGDGRFESIEFLEYVGNEDSYCLTTSTGTWTTYRDEEVAAKEGVEAGPVWTGNTGGWGLMGWTGNFPDRRTGNKTRDMNMELPLIIKYVNEFGDEGAVRSMFGARSVAEAANIWGPRVERFGINDVHSEGISLATQIMNSSGGGGGHGNSAPPTRGRGGEKRVGLASGGIINEPVFGTGSMTGTPYLFGEGGEPEFVIPQSKVRGGGGGDTFNIFPPESATNPDAYARVMIQSIRDYKRKRGNQATGIG